MTLNHDYDIIKLDDFGLRGSLLEGEEWRL